ncbi:MAG: preprotein translocase subunit SecE [Planctomycetota bacterium]|nr:preprotein translocase subunit SecE [Planctomycetota bacterium]
MSLEIYKKGQGTKARVTAYVLLGLLVLFGAYACHGEFNTVGRGVGLPVSDALSDLPVIGALTWMKLISIGVFFVGMVLVHLFLNKPGSADLMIDTEQEMRKVSWPSWPEVKSASLVVVVVTFVFGLSLFAFDKALQGLFSFIF